MASSSCFLRSILFSSPTNLQSRSSDSLYAFSPKNLAYCPHSSSVASRFSRSRSESISIRRKLSEVRNMATTVSEFGKKDKKREREAPSPSLSPAAHSSNLSSQFVYVLIRLYHQRVIGDGIVPDSSVLDSMVICLVKLKKFDETRSHLDRCLASDYVPSRNSASLVVDELCNQDQFLDAFLYFEQVKVKGSGGLWIWCCKRLFKGMCIHGHLEEAIESIANVDF